MNRNKLFTIILSVIAVVAVCIFPVYTLIVYNDVLKNGTEHKFKVSAYDPYNPFLGNSLNISFNESWVSKAPPNYAAESNEWGWRSWEAREARAAKLDINAGFHNVSIATAKSGYAYFNEIIEGKPTDSNFFRADFRYGRNSIENLPQRYYLNETLSRPAEKAFRGNRDSAYAIVAVKDGRMIIKGIYVRDTAIEEFVQNNRDKYFK